MNSFMLSITSALLLTTFAVHGRFYEPVSLARELLAVNVSFWDIPTLVCLAHDASAFQTGHTGTIHTQSYDYNYYGLFGIPKIWMRDKCNLTVSELLDDDIKDDVVCVMKCINDRPKTLKRQDTLGAFTPGVVKLDDCFDWWETLPDFKWDIRSLPKVDERANNDVQI